ncbi:hypothetical protein [Thiocapsa sp. N5-Cardenillas]|uniref:hypothetical protein n=1 Tax=Thiocapsa sp. N5-Cardenillas TaxID=3137397 RepID=UPI0035B00605
MLGALIGLGASIFGASQQRKAAKKAQASLEAAKVDPVLIAQRAREQAIRGIEESIAAEERFTPEVARFRRESMQGLDPLLGDLGAGEQIGMLDEDIRAGGQAEESDLLTNAIAEAGRQLALGGELDPVTRAEVMRRAIAKGGRGSLGRYIAPRDLGLTSLGLQQQRLGTAGEFGQIEEARGQRQFENLQRLRQLRSSLLGNEQSRRVQLAGFGQNIARPDVSLSPSAFASLYTANQNIDAAKAMAGAKADSANAENWAKVISSAGPIIEKIF